MLCLVFIENLHIVTCTFTIFPSCSQYSEMVSSPAFLNAELYILCAAFKRLKHFSVLFFGHHLSCYQFSNALFLDKHFSQFITINLIVFSNEFLLLSVSINNNFSPVLSRRRPNWRICGVDNPVRSGIDVSIITPPLLRCGVLHLVRKSQRLP